MNDAPAPTKAESYDFDKAVVDGELRRLSVSQIASYDRDQDGGCPRKWFYEKVLGQKPPSTKAQETGTDIHAQIEHYLKTGENVLGPVGMAMKRFIPAPLTEKPGLLIEAKFGPTEKMNLDAAGVPVVGFMDLVNLRGEFIDETGELRAEGLNVAEANDWKTSSNVEKWAKPPGALMKTIQMPGYGEALRRSIPGLERVRLSHTTGQTKGQRIAVKSSTLVAVEEIVTRWSKIEGVVREMKDVAGEKDIEKVPANRNACRSFGGCPFFGQCPQSVDETFATIFGAKEQVVTQAIRGNLFSRLGIGAALASPPTSTTPAPVTEASTSTTAVAAPVKTEATSVVPAKAEEAREKYEATAHAAANTPGASTPFERGESAAVLVDMATLSARAEAAMKSEALATATVATAPVVEKSPTLAERMAAVTPPEAPKAPVKVKAGDARQGHTYETEIGGKPVKIVFNARTKAGMNFSRGIGEAPVILPPEADVVYLGGPVAKNVVLPPDAPLPGVSGPAFDPLPAHADVPEAVKRFQEETQAMQATMNPATTPTPAMMLVDKAHVAAMTAAVTEALVAVGATVQTPAPAPAPAKAPGRGRPKSPGTLAKEAVEEAIGNGTPVEIAFEDGKPVVRRVMHMGGGFYGTSPASDALGPQMLVAAQAEIEDLKKKIAVLEHNYKFSSDAAVYHRDSAENLKTEVQEYVRLNGHLAAEAALARKQLAAAQAALDPNEAVLRPANVIELEQQVATLKETAERWAKQSNDETWRANTAEEALKKLASGPSVAGITLYVNALPAKGAATSLAPYIDGITSAIAKAYTVEDFRLAKDLGFGTWKAALAVAVKKNPPAPGAYFVDARSDVNQVVVDALENLATVVVKGA